MLKKIFIFLSFISLIACNKTEKIEKSYYKNGQLKSIVPY